LWTDEGAAGLSEALASSTCLELLTPTDFGILQRFEALKLLSAAIRWLDGVFHLLLRQFAHYNFVRVHQSVRVTPAMAAIPIDHLWTREELLHTI
jgi:hypothetical protein